MKRILTVLVLVCALALPGMAAAQGNGMYLAPKLLMMSQNTGTVERSGMGGFGIDKYSQFTFGGAIAVGYDFWQQQMLPFRLEAELALRGNSEEEWNGAHGSAKQTFNATTLFLNGFYDFHNSSAVTPYVGAGLGLASKYFGVDVKTPHGIKLGSEDERRTSFAWNVGAGIAFAVNDHVSIDANYRYVDLGYSEVKADYGNHESVGIRPYNHEVAIGLRWGF